MAIDKAVTLSGGGTVMLSALGRAHAAAGQADQALGIVSELRELARSRYVSSFEIALIYAALGDFDTAFAWLELAYEERSGWLPYAGVEPRLLALRGDRRFAHLLERLGPSQLRSGQDHGAVSGRRPDDRGPSADAG